MRIFSTLSTYLFLSNSFLTGQDNYSITTFNDSLNIGSYLELLLENDLDLTTQYELDKISSNDGTVIYRKTYEEKYLDTIFIQSSVPLPKNISYHLTSSLQETNIGIQFDKKVKQLRQKYNFIQEPIYYKLGLIGPNSVAGILNIQPHFENQISAIMGLNQSENKPALSGKIFIHLENIFKNAGSYEINWDRIDSLTQKLDFSFYQPHIFSLKMGIRMNYSQEVFNALYSVTELENQLQFSTYYVPSLFIGISQGITRPTLIGKQEGYSKVYYKSFSLSILSDKTNHRIYPTMGYKYNLQIDLGIQNQSRFLESDYEIKYFFPAKNSFFAMLGLKGKFLNSINRTIPKSRLFYFGGNSTLRGYPEKSFISDNYQLTTLEVGHFSDSQLMGLIFFDVATTMPNTFDFFKIGYGVGVSQYNKNSIISVYFGVPGKFRMNNGKLHIKWIARL